MVFYFIMWKFDEKFQVSKNLTNEVGMILKKFLSIFAKTQYFKANLRPDDKKCSTIFAFESFYAHSKKF